LRRAFNRAIIERRNDYPLAEPEIRIRQARSEQKLVEQLRGQLDRIRIDADRTQRGLAPYDYSESYSPSDSLAGRAELRTKFAALDKTQRLTALADPKVRKAVLEQLAFASGMTPTEHADLFRMEIEERFAPQLKELKDAEHAVEQTKLALDSVDRALGNELQSIGQPVTEPPPKVPSDQWA
jgi:hypothetical protein